MIPHSTDRSRTQRAITFILQTAIFPPSILPATKLVPCVLVSASPVDVCGHFSSV